MTYGILKTLSLAVALLPAASLTAQTLFLADFEQGYEPSLPKSGAARTAASEKTELVEGRFGKGVHIPFERETGKNPLVYILPFPARTGTLEFWIKPDSDFVGKRHALFGVSSGVCRLDGWVEPDGTLAVGYFINNFEQKGMVGAKGLGACFKGGQWLHVALSWDQMAARLFLDGHLVAMSSTWEVPDDAVFREETIRVGNNYYPFDVPGAGAVFDDFEISGDMKYVCDFIRPEAPASARPIPAKPKLQQLAPKLAAELEKRAATFFSDFRNGAAIATFAKGETAGFSDRALIVDADGKLSLKSGDTLGFRADKNLSPFRGTFSMTFLLNEPLKLPTTLLERSRICGDGASLQRQVGVEKARSDGSGALAGLRLSLDKENRLKWESFYHKQTFSTVASAPLELKAGVWHNIVFAWDGPRVRLDFDGKTVAEAGENAMPSILDEFFFVGSNCVGDNSLDGQIGEIEIDDKFQVKQVHRLENQ